MAQAYQKGFNVRAYGILVNDVEGLGPSVLLSHEFYDGPEIRKFPGGGLEFRESPGNTVVREFEEEVGVKVELGNFHYTSPNFYSSYFRPMQLIALYWQVSCSEEIHLPQEPVPIAEGRMRMQQLYWQPLSSFEPDKFNNGADKEAGLHLLHLAAKAPFW